MHDFLWYFDIESIMLPWVESWCDVLGNGNYGFRAFALQLIGRELEWENVRVTMYNDLVMHQELYDLAFIDPIAENIQHLVHWK